MNKTKLIKFNKRLHLFQDRIIKEVEKIDAELMQRIEDKNDILEDYEIELDVIFFLKEDDLEYDKEQDNIVAILNECVKGISILNHKSCRWDKTNHNEFQNWAWHDMNAEHHCWLYHCLYDHIHLEWEDILRIGSMWSDVNVKYQYLELI